MTDTAKALVPLDVEAVARWLHREFGIPADGAAYSAEMRGMAQRFVATFGVPAPDAEALRIAEEGLRVLRGLTFVLAKAGDYRPDSLSYVTPNEYRETAELTIDAIARRLRGQKEGK